MPSLSQRAREAARTAARSRFGRRLRRPRLSVIVPFYNVEQYLAECLDSILSQGFGDFEVLLVDDGSPDGSRAIAARYVDQDSRITLLTRENGGLGAARNTGVRAARGEYLTFIDSDDVLPPGALGALMGQAGRTGSDIVCGAIERFDSRRRWRPFWVDRVQSTLRERITAEEFLPILRNLYTWNKVYRRDFWEAQDLWFREGVAYEDQPIVTQLLARATSIDLIPETVYSYRARDDKSSISQQTATVKDLKARIEAWRISEAVFRGELSQTLYDEWLATLFYAHFHWYLTSRGTADDEYWNLIAEAVTHFSDQAPESVWAQTPVPQRVLVELTRQGRRADALELVRRDHTKVANWPATVVEGGVRIELPFFGDAELGDELFVVPAAQLSLVHRLDVFGWRPDEEGVIFCELAGWAAIAKVDAELHPTRIEVVLRHRGTGAETVFGTSPHPSLSAAVPGEDAWCDYRSATFRTLIPVADLAAAAVEGTWEVLLRVHAAGFTVTEPITQMLRSGSAGTAPVWVLDDHRRVQPRIAQRRPMTLTLLADGVPATEIRLVGRTLSGRVLDGAVHGVEVAVGNRAVKAPVRDRRFEVSLPELAEPKPGKERSWRISAQRDGGAGERLIVRDDAVAPMPPGASLIADRNRLGELRVREWLVGVEADEVALDAEGGLVLGGSAHGPVEQIQVHSTGFGAECRSEWVPVVNGRFRLRLDLKRDLYRFGRLPLPYGDHDLGAVVRAAGEEHPVPLATVSSLAEQLPIRVLTVCHQGNVQRGPGGSLRVALNRPVGDRGTPVVMRSLRTQTAERSEAPLLDGILFRSYFGEQVTDSGIGIQAELRRRGSDLPVYWAVQDHSTPVPEGGIPVIVNSDEWYRIAGSISYYVDNMFQPDYLTKRPGQIFVQTFHGYPFKQMGQSLWRSQQLADAEVESYRTRAAEWDYLVSPARYATPLLRKEFGFEGEVLEIGYPRNDALFAPDRDAVRAQVRDSLGIDADQVAVLYAPTFRDYLSEDDKRAEFAALLDLEQLVAELGDRYVLLVRGHAFNARARADSGAPAGWRDLTAYPEINDLILASDVAVLDYSSLRFDYALTGKPMVFHVPDLELYRETRGWLFDFAESAPGPFTDSTEQVAAQLKDLAALRAAHQDAYARFAASYLDLDDGGAAVRFVDQVVGRQRGD